MIIYRISNSLYSDDITGTGAKLTGSRWNSKGFPMLYTAEHISLAVLEMLVHTNFKDYSINLDLLTIQLPQQALQSNIDVKKLKKDWTKDINYSRFIGDEFIKDKQNLVLRVPSAVIEDENNYLVNPLHPDFKKVKIIETRSFKPDERFFSIK
ncbi:MAG: RES domain-containing protein [Sphingobacteriales bacterium]|nr:MAG: RES domain-containing protein [Sphingobacteriales bacterium]